MAQDWQIDAAARTPRRRRTSPWMLNHRDEEREQTVTHVPYADAQGEAAARRERITAALLCLRLDPAPGDLLDVLGIPAGEIALARQVLDRLTGPS
jgi:hypothetical protein